VPREEEVAVRMLSRPDARVPRSAAAPSRPTRVREALREHVVVHLDVDSADAWRRAPGKGRPLARDRAASTTCTRAGGRRYERAADARLPAADRGVAVRAVPALLALREAPVGVRMAWARAGGDEYPVFLGRGLLANGFFWPAKGRRFEVTDENVGGLHTVRPTGTTHSLQASATRRSAGRGGAAGDGARGSRTRGSRGGGRRRRCGRRRRGLRRRVPAGDPPRAGADNARRPGGLGLRRKDRRVDLPEGKNYAGAYHQPAAVIADPATLGHAAARERAAATPRWSRRL